MRIELIFSRFGIFAFLSLTVMSIMG